MDLIQGIIQPPKAQSVEETIPTLCDRLENATLISDRRSAVLGLKSFSREYRETVIASGLKTLINTLIKDQEDHDLVRALLETLLILFIRGEGEDDLTRNWISQQSRLQNGKYPSPLVMKEENETVDQFSLWITDALTQTDEVVKLLFTFLDTSAFHIKLYTIQLLEALISTRPLKTREVILNIPTGVSTLVKLLDDINEPIRDETILLLMAVVNDNSHFQKLVAFENVFEKLFSIIDDEGGLRGSLVVNDCLSLINNILKYNTSNQTLFFETGNLHHLINLLNEPLSVEEEFFWNEQRMKNINTVLDIIRLTVEDGNSVTSAHQNILYESQVLMVVLRLAFFIYTPNSIKLISLLTVADMIKNNATVQQKFSQIDVPYWDPSVPSYSSMGEPKIVPVLTLLLSWTLLMNSVHIFDIRVASLEVLKAFFFNNKDNILSFLQSQIKQYELSSESMSIDDDEANILQPIFNYDPNLNLNPYKLFFSTDLLMFFMATDDTEGKIRSLIRSLSSGTQEEDEESMVAVQTVGELLITNLSSQDIRIPIAFASFLIFWLYEDSASVDELLRNKSLINNFISFSLQVEHQDTCLRCLTTMLLGIVYEFSSVSSPFSRADLYSLLVSRISPDNYASRIKQLRENELFTNSLDVYLNPTFDETGLPNVFFSTYFSELVIDNFYRIQSSLRRGPKDEPDVKITFELYEKLYVKFNKTRADLEKSTIENENVINSLNSKLEKLSKSLEHLETEKVNAETELNQLNERHSALEVELNDTKIALESVNNKSQKLEELKQKNTKAIAVNQEQIDKYKEKINGLQQKVKEISESKLKAEDGINKMSRELFTLTKENGKLKEDLKSHSKKLEMQEKKYSSETANLEKQLKERGTEVQELRERISEDIKRIDTLEKNVTILSNQKIELETKLSNQTSLIPKLTEKLKGLANNYKDLENERDTLAKKILEKEEANKTIMQNLNSEIESLNKEREEMRLDLQYAAEYHQKEKENFDAHTQKLTSENNSKSESIISLQTKLDECERQIKEYKTTNEELKNSLHALNVKCIELESSLESAKQSTDNSDKTIEELNDSVIAINDELQSVLAEKDELLKQNNKINEELCNYQQELQEKADSCQGLQDKISSLNNEIMQISEESNDKIKLLEASNEEKVAEIKDLKSEISNIKQNADTKAEKLKSEIDALKSRISDLESLLETKNKLYENSQTTITELEQAKEKLQRTIQEQYKEAQYSEDSLLAGENKIKHLESQLEKLKLSSVSKEKEAHLKDEEIKSVKAEIEDNVKLVQAKSTELDELKKQNSVLNSKLNKEKEKAKIEQHKLRESLATARDELKSKIKDFEEERKLLSEGSSELNQQYSEKILKLEETLNNVKADHEKAVQKLENTIEALEQQAEESKSSLDTERSLSSKEQQQRLQLEKILANEQKENKDLENKLADLDQLFKEHENTLESQTKISQDYKQQLEKNSQVIEELKSAESALKDKLIAAEEKIKESEILTSQLDKAVTSTSALLEEQTKLKKSISDLEAKNIKDCGEMEILRKELSKCQESLKVSQRLNEEKDEANKRTETDIVSLQKEINTLKEELRTKNDEISCFEADKKEMIAKLKELEESKTLLVHSAQEKNAQMIQENTSLAEEIKELKLQVNTWTEKLVTSEQLWSSEKTELIKQMDIIKTESAKQAQENSQLNVELSAIKEENMKLKNRVDDRSEVDDLMILVTDLDEQKSKYKRKLIELGVELSSDEESDQESGQESE